MKPHNQQTRMEAVRLFREEGISKAEISRKLNVSYDSTRSWIKRYEEFGEKGLVPDYSACGRCPRFSQKVIQRALKYKDKHKEWGAPFILVKLEDDFPGEVLPGPRRLQQIFKKEGLQPQRTRLPRGKASWAERPFDRVQVDAKERLKTADGKDCCYLNFTDEHTGSDLDAFVFPLCPNQ